MAAASFTWRDGERVVRFGRGTLASAPSLLGVGYLLLTTPRAAATARAVVAAAGATVEVPQGRVDDVAAELLPAARASDAKTIVALGGGRVIDVAKALAAATGGRRVAALPTTLSAAEMSSGHRHAAGVDPSTPRVRPAIVLNDPDLSASQPPGELAASALNALGHACEAPLTTAATPVPTLAAHEAARLIVSALPPGGGAPDRDALALGALLSGYALDATGVGLHHVLAQTLVRIAGVGHGPANAVLLPHSLDALERRDPDGVARLAQAIGEPPTAAARRIRDLTGAPTLTALGVEGAAIERCATAAAHRSELARTPPPAGRAEIAEIYAAAR